MTLEKSKEHIAKFADCWVKVHQKLSLNWIQYYYRTVARWVSYFKEGRSSVKDEARPDRPVSATSENDVATVRSIVQHHSQYKVEEISDLSGLSSSYVFAVLKEKLKLQKICAHWIPHLLTPEQKKDHVEKASVLLSRFKNQDSHHLREVVTGDETWLYFFEPVNKLNNKMWISENNECPVVACRSRSVRRVMYALFFDSDGILACVSVPENCSVTGTFYSDFVFSAVVNHYQAKHPRARVRGIKLLRDNAPAHRSAVVKSYLEEFHIQVLPHPPYSPDLSPCDFWLSPYIKSCLRGRTFETLSAVGSALYTSV